MENIVCYNIRLYRKQKHISQQELADMLGVSSGCISLWESGARFPKYSMLLKLADLFQIPVEVLTGSSLSGHGLLSSEEEYLLTRYRNASEEQRIQVRSILGIE